MLTKNAKIRVLENFYAIDYVLLGMPATEAIACCPGVLEEYLSVKGAVMSTIVEMMKAVDYNPTITGKISRDKLDEMAKHNAQLAKENAKVILSSTKGKQSLNESIRSDLKEHRVANINSIIRNHIKQKSFTLALDNLLVARTLTEATDPNQLNDWRGRIIEDGYKILRNNLVELGLSLSDDLEFED